jgi:hypothetical protein
MENMYNVPDAILYIVKFSTDFQDWVNFMTTCKTIFKHVYPIFVGTKFKFMIVPDTRLPHCVDSIDSKSKMPVNEFSYLENNMIFRPISQGTKIFNCITHLIYGSKRRIGILKSRWDPWYNTLFMSDKLFMDFWSQFSAGKLYETYGLFIQGIIINNCMEPIIDYDKVFDIVTKYSHEEFISLDSFKIFHESPHIVCLNDQPELIDTIISFIEKYRWQDFAGNLTHWYDSGKRNRNSMLDFLQGCRIVGPIRFNVPDDYVRTCVFCEAKYRKTQESDHYCTYDDGRGKRYASYSDIFM